MVPDRVKLLEKPYHISEFLTHWTGREKDDEKSFDILSKIVDSKELKFSKCLISPINPTGRKAENEMICFTDTPILQSRKHCEKYNFFGISFNKKQMMEYGANPVLYLVESRYDHQDFHIDLTFKGILESNKEKNLFSWIGSIFQPYDKGHSDYYEREWRIIRLLPFPWLDNAINYGGSFEEYPFKGKLRSESIDSGVPNHSFYMEFEPNIIENIIVPEHYENEGIELLKRNGIPIHKLTVIEK
jgi:hypothetical protein